MKETPLESQIKPVSSLTKYDIEKRWGNREDWSRDYIRHGKPRCPRMISSSCATYDNYKCKTNPHNANPSKLPSRNPHGCFFSFISRMLDLIIFLQFNFLYYMLLNCFGNDLDLSWHLWLITGTGLHKRQLNLSLN
jgi:hypothetical protein